MSYKCNNLIPFPYAEGGAGTVVTKGGITFTVLNDGGIHIKGVNYDGLTTFWLTEENILLPNLKGGNYYIIGEAPTNIRVLMNVVRNNTNGTQDSLHWLESGKQAYLWKDTYTTNAFGRVGGVYIQIESGKTVDGIVYPILNEGTVALPYEPYYDGLKPAKVTEIKSVAEDTTVDAISIPSAITIIEGYGEGNPDNADEYNYIDFERKKFVAVGHFVNGAWATYEQPIETDLSGYDALSEFIQVVGRGHLEFVNARSRAIPSEISYLLKEGSI